MRKVMQFISKVTLLMIIAMLSYSAFASDSDGRCLKIAERQCAGVAEAFGSDSAEYYECVSVRLNRCLQTGR